MQTEFETMIALHNEAIKKLARQQFAEELRVEILKKLEAANCVCEYTAHPDLAIYNSAMEEVLKLLEMNDVELDPARVNAAVQMGFITERSRPCC